MKDLDIIIQITKLLDDRNKSHSRTIFDPEHDLINVYDNKNNFVAAMQYTYIQESFMDMLFEPAVINIQQGDEVVVLKSMRIGKNLYKYALNNNKHNYETSLRNVVHQAKMYESYLKKQINAYKLKPAR